MATFRNSSTASGESSNTSINKPAGVVSGDVQYALMVVNGSSATITISGGATWSLLGTLTITNGQTGKYKLYRQVAGSSEPSTYTVAASDQWSGQVRAYSGVNSSTPEATAVVTDQTDHSPDPSPVTLTTSGITTTATNQTVIKLGSVCWNGDSSGASWTDPAGFGNVASTDRKSVV